MPDLPATWPRCRVCPPSQALPAVAVTPAGEAICHEHRHPTQLARLEGAPIAPDCTSLRAPCHWCGRPCGVMAKPVAHNGRTLGYLCPEHSAEAADMVADAFGYGPR